MTHDQLRELAIDAHRHPMLTGHVLALADGILQLLGEDDNQRGLMPDLDLDRVLNILKEVHAIIATLQGMGLRVTGTIDIPQILTFFHQLQERRRS